MEVIHSLSNYRSSKKTIVTIGTFDGVHIGHQKIIEQLVNTAKKTNKKSVLLTFFPHPKMVLQKEASIELIDTIEERSYLLSKTELDCLIIHPFNKKFSQLTALDFIKDILIDKLNISKLIIGYDHHFGKNREGNIEQLVEYGRLYDFEVEEITAQNVDDISVSSTKIRRALASKNIETANKYLGYYFMLNGRVVKGEELGDKIGFPTANIYVKERYKIIPETGVYIVKSIFDNKEVFGMMNVGFRPTIDGKHQTIEVHFFDFNQDLYGREITVEILYFLRDEQKFNSIELLITQLKKDKENTLNYLKMNRFIKK